MHPRRAILLAASAALTTAPFLCAGGAYSAAFNDPTNPHDAPVPGFLGPHGIGKAKLSVGVDQDGSPIVQNPGNFINPVFFTWADAAEDYQPSGIVTADFNDPQWALGQVSGDHFFGIVSLGDMTSEEIVSGTPPGTITVRLARPVRNLKGADFVVFENAYIAQYNFGGAGAGGVFGELAYVEVSADGVNFVRFPSVSLTLSSVGPYGSIDATNIFNLAGKHVNSYGDSWGTPFDLSVVGLPQITHVRIVDIPGNGLFQDSQSHPIYDAWRTTGSGGFDLEAVGGISTEMTYADWPQLEALPIDFRDANDDPDSDGVQNLLEYAFARLPWSNEGGGNLPVMVNVNGQPAFSFIRDERLIDVKYELQATGSLSQIDWITIAVSEDGGPLLANPDQSLSIDEESASNIASLGVVRRVFVRESMAAPADKRFFRLKVTRQSTP